MRSYTQFHSYFGREPGQLCISMPFCGIFQSYVTVQFIYINMRRLTGIEKVEVNLTIYAANVLKMHCRCTKNKILVFSLSFEIVPLGWQQILHGIFNFLTCVPTVFFLSSFVTYAFGMPQQLLHATCAELQHWKTLCMLCNYKIVMLYPKPVGTRDQFACRPLYPDQSLDC